MTSTLAQDAESKYRGTLSFRIGVVAATLVGAFVIVTLTRRFVPFLDSDLASLCVGWIAVYPITLLNRRYPWWMHWVNGIFVVAGFWLVSRH